MRVTDSGLQAGTLDAFNRLTHHICAWRNLCLGIDRLRLQRHERRHGSRGCTTVVITPAAAEVDMVQVQRPRHPPARRPQHHRWSTRPAAMQRHALAEAASRHKVEYNKVGGCEKTSPDLPVRLQAAVSSAAFSTSSASSMPLSCSIGTESGCQRVC